MLASPKTIPVFELNPDFDHRCVDFNVSNDIETVTSFSVEYT